MNSDQLEFFRNFYSVKPDVETKFCGKCGKNKPVDSFRFRDRGAYRRTECKDCEKRLGKERRDLRTSTPPPPEDHTCPICGGTGEEVKGKGGLKLGPWVCDHDHKTKEFRGWLCHNCNRSIGNFKDNVELLYSAIKYLKKI